MRIAGVVLVIALLAGRAEAGNGVGFLIPPAEVDLGVGIPTGPASQLAGSSTEILAGLSWASLAWKSTRLDFGGGFVGSFRDLAHTRSFRGPADEDDQLAMLGGYLSMGHTLVNRRHARAWLQLRGELLTAELHDRRFSVLGVAARLATEVYVRGAAVAFDRGSGAGIVGALALGVFVEAGYRDLPDSLGPTAITLGVSMRVPLIFVAVK